MRVLLIEDDAGVVRHLQDMLGSIGGFSVVQICRTQKEALDWLSASPDGWDIAMIDLFLAEGHGFAILKHCQSRQPHQRAVVLTNYTREPVPDVVREAGADGTFDKTRGLSGLMQFLQGLKSADAH